MNPVKRYNLFSKVSLAIVGFCCVINTVLLLDYFLSVFPDIDDVIYSLNAYTWHIYAAFAVITLIVKLFMEKENNKYNYQYNIIMHIIFTLLSLCEVFFVFANSQ